MKAAKEAKSKPTGGKTTPRHYREAEKPAAHLVTPGEAPTVQALLLFRLLMMLLLPVLGKPVNTVRT